MTMMLQAENGSNPASLQTIARLKKNQIHFKLSFDSLTYILAVTCKYYLIMDFLATLPFIFLSS